MTLRRWLVLIVFALLAVPGRAQTDNYIEDISARLEARLKALPDRWDEIHSPLVPFSCRSSEEVLATASEEEQAFVSEWITFPPLSHRPNKPPSLTGSFKPGRSPRSTSGFPKTFTDELRAKSPEEPALYIEA